MPTDRDDTDGSGEAFDGKYIISYEKDRTGGECALRQCFSVPSTAEEVGRTCPPTVTGRVPQDWLENLDPPPTPGNIPDQLLAQCRLKLAVPMLQQHLATAEEIKAIMDSVAFSASCSSKDETCKLIEDYALSNWVTDDQDPGQTTDPPDEETTTQMSREEDDQEANKPNATASRKDLGGSRPGRIDISPRPSHDATSGGREFDWPKWILSETRALEQDPLFDPSRGWRQKGKMLFQRHLDQLQKNSTPAVDFGQSILWRGQKKLQEAHEEAWTRQTYFGLSMGGATVVTLLVSLILAARYFCRLTRGIAARLAVRKEQTESRQSEKRARRKREQAQDLAGTMREIGLLPDPGCPPRGSSRAAGLTSPEERSGLLNPTSRIEIHSIGTQRISDCAEPRPDSGTTAGGKKKATFFGLGTKSGSSPNLESVQARPTTPSLKGASGAAGPPSYTQLAAAQSGVIDPATQRGRPGIIASQITYHPFPQTQWERHLNECAQNPPEGLEYMVESPSSPQVGTGEGTF